jgi:hypothetical protein
MDRCGCVSSCVCYINQYQPTPEAVEELHYTQTFGVYIMLFAVTTTSHFFKFLAQQMFTTAKIYDTH